MKYTCTRVIVGFNFNGLKPGQWVQLAGQKTRGQYMGTTAHGTEVIRWQNETATFSKTDAKANKPLRRFAKVYGSR